MIEAAEGDIVRVEVDGVTYAGTVEKVHRDYPLGDEDWVEIRSGDGVNPILILASVSQVDSNAA